MKEEKEKDIIKNKPHMEKAVAVPNLNIKYRRKKKQWKKRQKNIKDITTMMMKMIYDDDNNANYEKKKPIKQTRNKKERNQ